MISHLKDNYRSRYGGRLAFLLVMVAFLFSSQAQAWWIWTPGDTVDDSSQSLLSKGYKPTQPIPFSHVAHADKRQIPCEYCHSAARRSTSAGIPSSNTCMGCHQIVAADKEPIKFLTQKYEKNEPIEWIKVHDLPDHVRFSHMPHVNANITCQTCHGAVEKMEVVEQWAPLQMGWCISCHKEQKAKTDCMACHY